MDTFIIDTSVTVKWFNQQNEQNVKQAKKVYDRLLAGEIVVITPDLLALELQNALLKGKKLKADEISEVTRILYSLPLVIKPPTLDVLENTAKLAEGYNLTIYDALFVAMAKEHECKLISDDKIGHGQIKDGTVILLADY